MTPQGTFLPKTRNRLPLDGSCAKKSSGENVEDETEGENEGYEGYSWTGDRMIVKKIFV